MILVFEPCLSIPRAKLLFVPGYFESQSQKLKKKASFSMKYNWRRKTSGSCRWSEQSEKESADVSTDINANLNSNKLASTPIVQSQNWENNEEIINPSNSEHTSRDWDMHEDIQHEGAGLGLTEEQTDCIKIPFGPVSKSPDNKASLGLLGPLARLKSCS